MIPLEPMVNVETAGPYMVSVAQVMASAPDLSGPPHGVINEILSSLSDKDWETIRYFALGTITFYVVRSAWISGADIARLFWSPVPFALRLMGRSLRRACSGEKTSGIPGRP